MSLFIDVDTVSKVMIGNQWFDVLEQEIDGKLYSSFDTDAYEIVTYWWNVIDKTTNEYGGGTGYKFSTKLGKEEVDICGPIEAIQAIVVSRTLRERKRDKIAREKKEYKRQGKGE